MSKKEQTTLEEAANAYGFSCYKRACFDKDHKWPSITEDAFKAGAEWQKKRFEAEYELDWITDLKKDLYELGRKDEREQMMDEWLKDRDGCFWDGVNEGKKAMKEQMMKDGNVILAEEDFDAEKEKLMEWGYNLCKEQMMKDAVEGVVEYNFDENGNGYYSIHPTYVEESVGQKVRIIIVKEDEQ